MKGGTHQANEIRFRILHLDGGVYYKRALQIALYTTTSHLYNEAHVINPNMMRKEVVAFVNHCFNSPLIPCIYNQGQGYTNRGGEEGRMFNQNLLAVMKSMGFVAELSTAAKTSSLDELDNLSLKLTQEQWIKYKKKIMIRILSNLNKLSPELIRRVVDLMFTQ